MQYVIQLAYPVLAFVANIVLVAFFFGSLGARVRALEDRAARFEERGESIVTRPELEAVVKRFVEEIRGLRDDFRAWRS